MGLESSTQHRKKRGHSGLDQGTGSQYAEQNHNKITVNQLIKRKSNTFTQNL